MLHLSAHSSGKRTNRSTPIGALVYWHMKKRKDPLVIFLCCMIGREIFQARFFSSNPMLVGYRSKDTD